MMKIDTEKKIILAAMVVLSIFLVVWIKVYPWGNEQGSGANKDTTKNRNVEERVEEMIADMTMEEMIYQMFIVSPEQITGVETVVAAGEATKKALEEYPVGGIIYFAKNLVSQEQIKKVIANSQEYSKIDLFIAVDEEGGKVNRLMNKLGTTYIDSMYNYKDKGKKTAKKHAETIAKDMKKLGFNLDFAPVADVWSNPDCQVIGERAYSNDFHEAAKLVGAAVEGFHKGGVLCTLKHFPGHGSTYTDTHTSVAHVTKGLKKIKKEELLPFEEGIEKGADFVMTGHMIVDAIDEELPASLSEKVVTDLLRTEMGYEGLIITDALNMGAVANNYSNAESAVLAVKAGNDMLLEPQNLQEAVDAITEAVIDGEISINRIKESVKRILTTKMKNEIIGK